MVRFADKHLIGRHALFASHFECERLLGGYLRYLGADFADEVEVFLLILVDGEVVEAIKWFVHSLLDG